MARYEGSKADEANDRREAKKHGMTLKAWEASAMDAREDARMQAKMDRDEAKMRRDKTTPHVFAHKRPVT